MSQNKLKLLETKLLQGDIPMSTKEFTNKLIKISIIYSALINLGFVFILLQFNEGLFLLLAAIPISFMLIFTYFLKFPDYKIIKRKKEIDREIIYAGRYLLIALASGVPLFDALKSIGENFPHTGKIFKKIVDKVRMGTPIEIALKEGIEESPSQNCRKLLWQVVNALHTGSDPSTSLQAVTDQIAKEQIIELERYAKKLNPLAMFYMMIAVIVPSLGVTMLIVFSTLMNLTLELWVLLFVVAFIAFVQFMFISVVKASRPGVTI